MDSFPLTQRIIGWLLQDDVINATLVPLLYSCFKTYQIFFPKHKEWLLELIGQLVADAQEHCCDTEPAASFALVIEYPTSASKYTIPDDSQVYTGISLELIIIE
jgi:hypothetical protein